MENFDLTLKFLKYFCILLKFFENLKNFQKAKRINLSGVASEVDSVAVAAKAAAAFAVTEEVAAEVAPIVAAAAPVAEVRRRITQIFLKAKSRRVLRNNNNNSKRREGGTSSNSRKNSMIVLAKVGEDLDEAAVAGAAVFEVFFNFFPNEKNFGDQILWTNSIRRQILFSSSFEKI